MRSECSHKPLVFFRFGCEMTRGISLFVSMSMIRNLFLLPVFTTDASFSRTSAMALILKRFAELE